MVRLQFAGITAILPFFAPDFFYYFCRKQHKHLNKHKNKQASRVCSWIRIQAAVWLGVSLRVAKRDPFTEPASSLVMCRVHKASSCSSNVSVNIWWGFQHRPMTSLRTQPGLQGGLTLTETACRIALKRHHPRSRSLIFYTLQVVSQILCRGSWRMMVTGVLILNY